MKEIRLGIIGCGGMGTLHAERIGKIDGAVVQGAADLDVERLEQYRRQFSVPSVFPDYTQLIGSGEIDAVIVCLPTHLHVGPVVTAAEAGLPVFCEKPLARTMAQAEEMKAACDRNGVFLQIGFVRRFDNCWLRVRDALEEKALGIPVVWRDIRAGFGPGNTGWYFDRDKGGGPLIDGMVHNYDFGNYIFGSAASITAGRTRLKQSTAFDTGSVWIEYEDGNAMANIWSWGLPEGVSGVSGMDMIGPEGALLSERSFDPTPYADSYNQDSEGIHLLKRQAREPEPLAYKKNDMFLDQMHHFVECVRTEKIPKVGIEDGIAALRVALTVLAESEEGER